MRALILAVLLLAPAAAEAQVKFELNGGFWMSDAIQERRSDVDGSSGGVSVGAALTGRTGGVEIGVTGDLGAGFLDSMNHLALVAGPAIDGSRHTRVTLLGELGYSFITGVGNGLFSSARGDTTATLPYAGLKVGLNHDVGRGNWSVGYGLVLRRHLEQRENHVSVETCFLGCNSTMETYDVGGTYVGVIFNIAVK